MNLFKGPKDTPIINTPIPRKKQLQCLLQCHAENQMRSVEGYPGTHKYSVFTEPGDTLQNNKEKVPTLMKLTL